MLINHFMKNLPTVFTIWIFLTLINQVAFFGSCLRADCILASVPHVSLITLIVFYSSFKHECKTFDERTGYNSFGYNQNGYDRDGYSAQGYDSHGYNRVGITSDGVDRLGRKFIGRFFSSTKDKQNLERLNKEALQKNKAKVYRSSKAAKALDDTLAKYQARLDRLNS